MSEYLIKHFWDEQKKIFYFTSDNHEELIIRPTSKYDLSMPSGNSVVAGVFLKLYQLTQEEKFHKITQKIIESQGEMAVQNPFAFGNLLNVIYLEIQNITEITLLNNKNSDLILSLNKKFLPESLMIMLDNETKLDLLSKIPFFILSLKKNPFFLILSDFIITQSN